jgi:hypothetical protein
MTDDRSKMRDGDMPLLDRIESAMRRVTSGQGQMRVPVDATDPDVVLHDCKREIERLKRWEGAAREWIDKTEWVQERIDSGHLPAKYLGKHRADIMRAEVDRLRATLARLACLGNGDRYGNSEGNMIAREALENVDAR